MAGGISAIGNLLGKVDANGALLVALDGTSPATASRFFGDASATLPAFSITGDTDTGFGASAANTAAIWAGGTTPRVTVSSTAVTSTVPILVPDGTASAPFLARASTPTIGLNFVDASTMDYSTGGTSQVRMSAGTTTLETRLLIGSNAGYSMGTAMGGPKRIIFSATAPTISSGFGTSPSVVASNGTAAFKVNVGTGGTASSGVIALPAMTTEYNGSVDNRTALLAGRADQRTVITASTTTTVTVQNQSVSTGLPIAWTASDVLHFALTGE